MTHFHIPRRPKVSNKHKVIQKKPEPREVKAEVKKSHKAKRENWILLVYYQQLTNIQVYGPFESYTHGRTWAFNNGVSANSLCLMLNDPDKGIIPIT